VFDAPDIRAIAASTTVTLDGHFSSTVHRDATVNDRSAQPYTSCDSCLSAPRQNIYTGVSRICTDRPRNWLAGKCLIRAYCHGCWNCRRSQISSLSGAISANKKPKLLRNLVHKRCLSRHRLCTKFRSNFGFLFAEIAPDKLEIWDRRQFQHP